MGPNQKREEEPTDATTNGLLRVSHILILWLEEWREQRIDLEEGVTSQFDALIVDRQQAIGFVLIHTLAHFSTTSMPCCRRK